MLSLQGMIAKDLDAQGVLPQKFKDLTLGPKYLIKFVNSKGIVPTADILPRDTYRFVNEDGSIPDFENSTWELEFHYCVTMISGEYLWEFLRFGQSGDSLKYKIDSSWTSDTVIHTLSNTPQKQWTPLHAILKMKKSDRSSNNVSFYVKIGDTEESARAQEFRLVGAHSLDPLKTDFKVSRCDTTVATPDTIFFSTEGQCYYKGMRFVYNNVVILGE